MRVVWIDGEIADALDKSGSASGVSAVCKEVSAGAVSLGDGRGDAVG